MAGFVALAPDGLTSVGGYPGTDEQASKLFGSVDRPKMNEDFIAAARSLGRPQAEIAQRVTAAIVAAGLIPGGQG